jgi:hypothetical protein
VKDKIFSNSIEYKDSVAVPPIDCTANDEAIETAEEVKDAIFDAMLAGKLDKTDIAIIRARDCSPMPSMREIAFRLKISLERVHFRIKHIKSLMPKDLQQHFNIKSNATLFFK